jgi:general secretion pathway protein J
LWASFDITMKRPTPFNCHGGFTLIELLVAIAIMSMMALMSWKALDGMQRTVSMTRDRSDQMATLSTGLAQWMTDLDAMIDTEQQGVKPFDFDGKVLRMTRQHPQDTDTASQGVMVVAWALQNGKWSRWQTTAKQTRQDLQQAWLLAAQWGQRSAPAAQEVSIAPASDWQLYVYRGGAWTHPQSDEGNGNLAGSRLPQGVRLVIHLSTGQALQGTLTRDWVNPTLSGDKS